MLDDHVPSSNPSSEASSPSNAKVPFVMINACASTLSAPLSRTWISSIVNGLASIILPSTASPTVLGSVSGGELNETDSASASRTSSATVANESRVVSDACEAV